MCVSRERYSRLCLHERHAGGLVVVVVDGWHHLTADWVEDGQSGEGPGDFPVLRHPTQFLGGLLDGAVVNQLNAEQRRGSDVRCSFVLPRNIWICHRAPHKHAQEVGTATSPVTGSLLDCHLCFNLHSKQFNTVNGKFSLRLVARFLSSPLDEWLSTQIWAHGCWWESCQWQHKWQNGKTWRGGGESNQRKKKHRRGETLTLVFACFFFP